MKNLILLLCLLMCFFCVKGQLNMHYLSNLNYQELHSTKLNDVWGYVDETGREYALVGAERGFAIVDISDPSNPVEVFWQEGTLNTWRDLVTNGDFLYVSTEALDGITIVDLSPLPQSNNLTSVVFMGTEDRVLRKAHTIMAKDDYLYVFGNNIGNGGVQIYSLANPMNPTWVGEFDNWYVHDGSIQNDTMYLGHIYDGFLSIVDITNKSMPVLLGTKTTPHFFTHSVWPTTNGNIAFTTDEVSGAYIASYDISDPTQIIELDRIQSSPGKHIVPHNIYVNDNFLVTSYYSDGVVVHDATYPYNLIEVANFDTYPGQSAGFDGCWGVYPYFPSGNIIATDREYGLFVLGVDYKQAAYLEGFVREAETNNPLYEVNISIEGWQHIKKTKETGFYATGQAAAGVVQVTYNKVGYYPQTLTIELEAGEIVVQDVELVKIPPYNLTIHVVNAVTQEEIPNAFILLESEYISHDGVTNAIGEEEMTLYYETIYQITVGKWGFVSKCMDVELTNSTGEITVSLGPGYYDDFTFDFGWTTLGTASQGLWERAIPFGTQEMANPDYDAPWDCGKYAYVTGNTPMYDFTLDEVDDGDAILMSPTMDLLGIPDPYINYFKWFYTRYGPSFPSDSMAVILKNGTQSVQIDVIKYRELMDVWEHASIRVRDYMEPSSSMQVVFITSDYYPDWNVVEAGVDHFWVSNGSTVSINDQQEVKSLKVYPNPFEDYISLDGLQIGQSIELVDLQGRIVKQAFITSEIQQIDTKDVYSGWYILRIGEFTRAMIKR